MSIAARLRLKADEKGWSEGELSRRSGVQQPTIHRILSGESGSPRKANIERLAKALGITPDWLLFGSAHGNVSPTAQPHKEAREYPLISDVAAGNWEESCDNFQPGDADEWLESNANAGVHGYWLEVKGPSMIAPNDTASFPPKMRILVQPEGFDLVSGRYYVAKLMDTGETTFKQYIRDAGVEYLQPLNPNFKTIEITDNVQIIGRVVDAKLPKSLF